MSLTAMWSSSPISMGRPSSPLNPHSNHPIAGPSSSPITSPTHLPSSPSPFSSTHTQTAHLTPLPPSFRHRSTSYPTSQPRYTRPNAKRTPTHVSPQVLVMPKTPDPFGESRGVTPVENAMWKKKFARRVQDRERRKRAREDDLTRRRSLVVGDEAMDEEEADRQAQADDEEIFRRMMVMQRKRAEHQHLVNYEVETGGSDPALPDFWDEDGEEGDEREAERHHHSQTPTRDARQQADWDDDPMATPKKNFGGPRRFDAECGFGESDEWEQQALEAEEAERDAEEAEVARRVEEAYGVSIPKVSNGDLDMDWDAFDAMDIE